MTKHIKFKVLGKSWILKARSKKKYFTKNGWDSVAITKIHKRVIELSPRGLDKETIVHELVHAYLSECCTKSADFDSNALEEIYAELLAKHGATILALATILLRKLKSVI